jgi:hypothetical protein
MRTWMIESAGVYRCGRCGRKGHTRRSCQEDSHKDGGPIREVDREIQQLRREIGDLRTKVGERRGPARAPRPTTPTAGAAQPLAAELARIRAIVDIAVGTAADKLRAAVFLDLQTLANKIAQIRRDVDILQGKATANVDLDEWLREPDGEGDGPGDEGSR